MRTLPQANEELLNALKSLAASSSPGTEWQGMETVLTSTMFGAFVAHANAEWFDTVRSFSRNPGVTTVSDFMHELRAKARLQPA